MKTSADVVREVLARAVEECERAEDNRLEEARFAQDEKARREREQKQVEAISRLAFSFERLADSLDRLAMNGIHLHQHR